MKKKISILGSTGSIGKSALEVIAAHPDHFEVVGLAEGHDPALLAEQIEIFNPKLVSVRDEAAVKDLKGKLKTKRPEIVHGIEGVCLVASMEEVETLLSAIVGSAGLLPTVSAIKKGKRIALANKETMVIAGELVGDLAKKHGSEILPVDSEHSAIFQSLMGHRREDLKRIILTASGGPFRRYSKDQMGTIKVSDALKHPRWSMGAKITIDSATLMNKGLEVIEARWLFNLTPDEIDVVIHPQSVIHSMVEYRDSCVIAELGLPDMKAPIAYALSYPKRLEMNIQRLELSKIGELTFEAPDRERFPSLDLAYETLRKGGSAPVILNASNEVAVDAFLKEKIRFTDIFKVVSQTLEKSTIKSCNSIEEILEIDRETREVSKGVIAKI